jgi:hypothetical protein
MSRADGDAFPAGTPSAERSTLNPYGGLTMLLKGDIETAGRVPMGSEHHYGNAQVEGSEPTFSEASGNTAETIRKVFSLKPGPTV